MRQQRQFISTHRIFFSKLQLVMWHIVKSHFRGNLSLAERSKLITQTVFNILGVIFPQQWSNKLQSATVARLMLVSLLLGLCCCQSTPPKTTQAVLDQSRSTMNYEKLQPSSGYINWLFLLLVSKSSFALTPQQSLRSVGGKLPRNKPSLAWTSLHVPLFPVSEEGSSTAEKHKMGRKINIWRAYRRKACKFHSDWIINTSMDNIKAMSIITNTRRRQIHMAFHLYFSGCWF